MIKKLLKDKTALSCITIILLVCIFGIFAPVLSTNDPEIQDIGNKFAKMSLEYPFGTDRLGRCTYSRILYGIRSTIFISFLTMVFTVFIGTLIGIISGYFKGIVDEVFMRICDIMLSFPSQVMILAIVGILGVGIENVIIANIVTKWTWYARMIRGEVIKYRNQNYIHYSKAIGSKTGFIILRHIIPNITAEVIILSTLDIGWVILNISTLSFLGLGIQAPTPEWGAMLSESKNVISTNPGQMLAPGLAILIVVAAFNLLGDSLRDAMDKKEVL